MPGIGCVLILPKLIFVGLVTSMYYVIPAGKPAFGRLTCYGAMVLHTPVNSMIPIVTEHKLSALKRQPDGKLQGYKMKIKDGISSVLKDSGNLRLDALLDSGQFL